MAEPLTPEEFRQYLTDALEAAKPAFLASGGSMDAWSYCILPDRSIQRFPIPGELMEDRQAKRLLFQTMAIAAKQLDALAVMFLSDTWHSEITPEQLKDPEHERLVRAGAGIPERCAAGFGQARECLLIVGQAPLFVVMVRQFYRRDGDAVIFEEQTAVEDSGAANHSGRLMTFYQGGGSRA